MKRPKLANVAKGRRIKRNRSGAVMLSMNDLSVSLRTLVRNRYLTQADGLRLICRSRRSDTGAVTWRHW
jgi:hypothetical protein